MVKNILITEKQLKKLTEIDVISGTQEFQKSWSIVFNYVDSKFEGKDIKKLIEKYFKQKLGVPLKDEEMTKIYGNFPHISGDIPMLKNQDILSNLAYFLAKKSEDYIILGNFGCLKWYRNYNIAYIFFDLELQESIGFIRINESHNNREYFEIPLVEVSSLDKEIKGYGYGKEMYLSLLDDVDVLGSDKYLAKESLNIWVNVLPKYVYVFAKLHGKSGFVSTMGKNKPNYTEVERYFATKNKEIFKDKI